MAVSFTSYLVSCFPVFQEMENTRRHEILRGRVLSYAVASLGSCKMILQNNFEPQKRGRMFSLVLEICIFQITWVFYLFYLFYLFKSLFTVGINDSQS